MDTDQDPERALRVKRSLTIALMRIERLQRPREFQRPDSRKSWASDTRQQRLRRTLAETFGLDEAVEIDAVLDDVLTLLWRCGSHQRLQARQRTVRQPPMLGNPVGPASVAVRRGRTKGAVNFAARQLGLGLAVIWAEQTGRRPTRGVGTEAGRVQGAYFRFVKAVLAVIPRRLLTKRKGQVPGLDAFIRQSIADYQACLTHPEENRRRGLIDDSLWYDPLRDTRKAKPAN